MQLSIDTSDSEKIVINLNGNKYQAESKIKKAQALLPFIVKCLSKESAEMKDIKEIKVHTGPGSFTGLRVGVSVANALGWALNIPVNGKRISENQFTEINYTSNH